MKRIGVIGAGKIGQAVAWMLTSVPDYDVILMDQYFSEKDIHQSEKAIINIRCDIRDTRVCDELLSKHAIDALISCLPYFCNVAIAQLAKEKNIHYFDVTEDITTTEKIKSIAKHASTAFVPQCGIAPGLINIMANTLTSSFDTLESIQLRAGALPRYSHNALHYALTWSTDGLINEYGNACDAISEGKAIIEKPLEGLETVILDGVIYEAFNTSGGLGSLWKKYIGLVNTMNYKTLRYPGHCEKIKILMNDLQLNKNRDILKKILETTLPTTDQDVVIAYVSVTGYQNKQLVEKSIVQKCYPILLNDHACTAIQCATASGVCAVLDLILSNPNGVRGFVHQEQFSYSTIIHNRFGRYYARENNSANF